MQSVDAITNNFRIRDAFSQAEHTHKREGGEHQHGCPGHQRSVAHHFPPERQPGHHQRGVRIRNRGMRNQATCEQEIARGWNVVAGLVPEVRQLQHEAALQREKYLQRQPQTPGPSKRLTIGPDYSGQTGNLSEFPPGSGCECKIEKYFLVHRARRSQAWVEFDLAEGALITGDILLQQPEQGLGLLRAEVDALEVANLDLSFGLLLQGAENHEEVPDIHPHLHAVGVGFAIVRSIDQLEVGLRRKAHKKAV